MIARVEDGTAAVRTDPRASPTGFPFKVVELRRHALGGGGLRGSASASAISASCAAPIAATTAASAIAAPPSRSRRSSPRAATRTQTVGRKCLCNSLLANVGLAEPQVHGAPEPPLLTAGDDLDALRLFLPPGEHDYGVAEVLAALHSRLSARRRRESPPRRSGLRRAPRATAAADQAVV